MSRTPALRRPTTTDEAIQLVYGVLSHGRATLSAAICTELNLTSPQMAAVRCCGLRDGWLVVVDGHHGTERWTAVAVPACCRGGYRPPTRADRAAPHVVIERLRRIRRSEAACA